MADVVIKDCPSKMVSHGMNQINALVADVTNLKASMDLAITAITEVQTKLSAHVHLGVSTGSNTSGTSGALTAAAVTDTAITAVSLTANP